MIDQHEQFETTIYQIQSPLLPATNTAIVIEEKDPLQRNASVILNELFQQILSQKFSANKAPQNKASSISTLQASNNQTFDRYLQEISENIKNNSLISCLGSEQQNIYYNNLMQFRKQLAAESQVWKNINQNLLKNVQKKLIESRDQLKAFYNKLQNKQQNSGDYLNFTSDNQIIDQLKLYQQQIHKIRNEISQFLTAKYKQMHIRKNQIFKRISNLYQNNCNIVKELVKIQIQNGFPEYPDYQEYFFQNQDNIVPLDTTNLSTIYNISLDQKSLYGLHPGNWLTSSVLINYIQYLKHSKKYNSQNSDYYILNQSESGSMISSGDFWDNLKRPSNPQGLLFTKYKYVGLVINKNNKHWFFIGVFNQSKQIIIYDSIASSEINYREYLTNIQNCILLEYKIKKQPVPKYKVLLGASYTPQQNNGSDCGLCTIMNLTIFLDNKVTETKRIYYHYEQIKQLRIGLHFFTCYLVYCKMNSIIVNFDYLQYCTRGIILQSEWNHLLKSNIPTP